MSTIINKGWKMVNMGTGIHQGCYGLMLGRAGMPWHLVITCMAPCCAAGSQSPR